MIDPNQVLSHPHLFCVWSCSGSLEESCWRISLQDAKVLFKKEKKKKKAESPAENTFWVSLLLERPSKAQDQRAIKIRSHAAFSSWKGLSVLGPGNSCLLEDAPRWCPHCGLYQGHVPRLLTSGPCTRGQGHVGSLKRARPGEAGSVSWSQRRAPAGPLPGALCTWDSSGKLSHYQCDLQGPEFPVNHYPGRVVSSALGPVLQPAGFITGQGALAGVWIAYWWVATWLQLTFAGCRTQAFPGKLGSSGWLAPPPLNCWRPWAPNIS